MDSRQSPIGHGRAGIELRDAPEEARGLVVIEAVQEHQTLIEKGLRLGIFRGDWVVMVPESGMQRRRAARVTHRVLCESGTDEEGEHQDYRDHAHGDLLQRCWMPRGEIR